jgi:hypothetical protein
LGIPATVSLFIDRLPLYTWTRRTAAGLQRLVAVSLPLHISEKGRRPPPGRRPQRWAVDTRFTAEAFAWRSHLLEAGLNPSEDLNGTQSLAPLGSPPQLFPLRNADLWLVSNIPHLQQTPWPLPVLQGIAFPEQRSVPDPDVNCPLLGMRALHAAGLRLAIDFRRETVSVWTPGSPLHAFGRFVRRLPAAFAVAPPAW